jgi:hypothetical protein
MITLLVRSDPDVVESRQERSRPELTLLVRLLLADCRIEGATESEGRS